MEGPNTLASVEMPPPPPVNLVDAISDAIPRIARAKTAVIRFGQIQSGAPAGYYNVLIGGATIQCNYANGLYLSTDQWVAVLNDRDVWLIIGPVAPTDPTVVGRPQPGGMYNHYYIGDPDYTGQYVYQARRNIDSQQYWVNFSATAYNTNGGGVDVVINGIVRARWTLGGDGLLNCIAYDAAGANGIYRPSPWASWAALIPVTFSNTAKASAAKSFPGGRFTVTPAVVSNMLNTSGDYFTFLAAASASSCTVGAQGYKDQLASVTRDCHTHALQMLSGATEGLADRSPYSLDPGQKEPDVVETMCRVAGCANEGHPVEMFLFDHTTSAECGVCDQPFTETQSIVERNLRRSG